MTNKEVELLLEDLSGRLPYGVKFHYFSEFADGEDPEFVNTVAVLDMADWQILDEDHEEWIRVRQIMPYLRPMSSMTEEEDKYFAMLQVESVKSGFLYAANAANLIKFLNSHHFDYRGLIPKGLALEATEGMYSLA